MLASSKATSPARRGALTLILGPMFSGKTMQLIQMHERATLAKRQTVVIKYANDRRYGSDDTRLVSGSLLEIKARAATRLSEVACLVERGSYVFIDEGQFFTDLDIYCRLWLMNGCVICVSALSGDFKLNAWEPISALVPLSTNIMSLTAVCRCGQDACYSHRRQSGDEARVQIGGSESYEALCAECYFEAQGSAGIAGSVV